MTAQEFKVWCEAWQSAPDDEFFTDIASRAMHAQIEAAERAPELVTACAEVWAKAIAWAAFWPSLAAVLWRVL